MPKLVRIRDRGVVGGVAAGISAHLRVPVGSTVTFLNPGAETFPNFPNQRPHCATQYFEGLFNPRLDPGQRFEFTFDRAGEYYFNDCTDPRPAGKIEVYPTPQDLPGALRFLPSTMDLGSRTGIFTGVDGVVTATLRLPAGYRLDGEVVLRTPLSQKPVAARPATVSGGREPDRPRSPGWSGCRPACPEPRRPGCP